MICRSADNATVDYIVCHEDRGWMLVECKPEKELEKSERFVRGGDSWRYPALEGAVAGLGLGVWVYSSEEINPVWVRNVDWLSDYVGADCRLRERRYEAVRDAVADLVAGDRYPSRSGTFTQALQWPTEERCTLPPAAGRRRIDPERTMVKLESIVTGLRLAGITGDQSVEVVATRAYGPNSLEVVWRGPDGLGERIFDRSDEPKLRTISRGRRFAFDGDGDLFRLASEALRIRLAHLFDPKIA